MLKSPFLLPVVLFIIALLTIGRGPLVTKGEAREALVVKDMIEQNNFILPLRNSAEIPSKPPLFHWIAAAASGEHASEFSVRLPSPIFAFIALSIFATLLLRLGINPLFSMLICASAFEWMRSSQSARVDMAFSGTLALTFTSFFVLLTDTGLTLVKRLSYSVLLSLGFAGAILSKGPAGGAIPLLITGVFFLPEFLKDFRSGFRKIFFLLPFILIGAGLAAWWYYEAYKIGGERFLDIQLFKENLSRLTGDGKFEVGHEKPFYWGPIELIVAFLPWSLALPLVIKDAYQERGYPSGSFKRFCLVIVCSFLIICSIATSKRPVYFLPVFPFLAYLVTQSFRFKEELFKKISLVILCGYAVVGLFVLPYFQRKNSVQEFSQVVNQHLNQGEKVYQVANDFYPTLFYSSKSLEKVGSLGELPSGSIAILKERDSDNNLVEVLHTSIGKADDGKGRLLLVKKKYTP